MTLSMIQQGFPAFGRRLKRLRRATGMKQAALAHVMRVDQASVSRWENGVQTPSPEQQAAVFAALSDHRADDAALKRLVGSSHAVCIWWTRRAMFV